MYKFYKTYFVLVFILLNFSVAAQFSSEEERLDHANELFENKSFIEAEPHMLHFLSTKNNAEFNFKYGVCSLFKYADKSKSLRYLEKAVKDSKVNPDAYFYLGKANHLNYLFADAIKNYNKFKSLVSEKDSKNLMVDMHISMCESGQGLMSNLSDLIVEDKTSTGLDKFQYSYDLNEIGGRILVTDQFQSKMDEKMDYKSIIYFPPVGQDMLFFSSYGKDGVNGLDLYSVNRLSTGDWSEPVRLPENINTPYDDSYPYLKPDGKTLYFSSKGHNSMGGYDVFRCNYDKVGGNFGPVDNLDYKINTPADDILYIVDDNNVNAYFSSNRASDGDKIDVYKVKVKVFPIQNTIIAGTFFNSSNPEDLKATIKVQDVRTDKLIGIYTVDKESNYSILLPNAGRYKFIVETPLSEKIHAGLVEVKPQTELKALKQEIELVDNDGSENLVIRNLFDQSHENESKILAAAVKQMANPEINIDDLPDSIINSSDQELVVEQEIVSVETEEENAINELLSSNVLNISNAEENLLDLKEQQLKFSNVAQLKSLEAEEKAIEADRLLNEASNEEEPAIKNEKLQTAAKLNLESKQANEEAVKSISIAKRVENDIADQEANIIGLKAVNEKIQTASDNNDQSLVNELIQEVNNLVDDQTPMDKLLVETKIKEKEANGFLNEAEVLRSDMESMQYQLDKQKLDLSKAKKKKDIASINENISNLEGKIAESEVMIQNQFSLYESAELERKQLKDEFDQMEKITLSDDNQDLSALEKVDLNELEEKTNNVSNEYIEKNSNEFESIVIIDSDNETMDSVLDNDSKEDIVIKTIADTLIDEQEIEHYNEVSETLESTTTQVDDFDNITETIISYNNDDAQIKSEELVVKKEEIVSIQNEIIELEDELSNSTKPSKIEEIQTQLELKKSLLSNTEDQLVKSYSEINEKEIDHNEEVFISSSKDLTKEAKSDEDFLSATYYMESAVKAIEVAEKKREEANAPSTSPEKRKELLKEAYQNEMVAIDDQQTANNLMVDVIKKYPAKATLNEVEEDREEQEELVLDEDEKAESDFVENSPITIPVVEKKNPVKVQKFQGETFDPKAEPENYEVVAIADPEPIVKPEEVSDSSNRAVIAENQKSIYKVNDLKSQKDVLELQKNDLIDEKLIAKVDKKIKKIEKKKAKSQLKMSSDIANVNQSEINILNEEVNSSSLEAENVKDQYKINQANNYKESATELSNQALNYREEAQTLKDPIAKADLIEKAIASENTAITYLKKSKKLYNEAIIEDFSDDKLTIVKSVESGEITQSEKLENLALISEDKAIAFKEEAQKIRENSSDLPKKERAQALIIAGQYDDLATKQTAKTEAYKAKSNKYKEIEMATVQDIQYAKDIENDDMSFVAGTEEFKEYNENQKSINELTSKREGVKVEQKSYERLSNQMTAKASSLEQQAKAEENPIKKADLISKANQFKVKSKENKQLADALVISIDSLKDEISSKEMDQEVILNGLDSTKQKQVRGLAVSGKADEIIEKISQELPENEIAENEEPKDLEPIEIEQEIENETTEEIIETEVEAAPIVAVSKENIRSKNFVPPPKIVKDIFLVTDDAVYSEENPIPLNPKLPEGLVYKVQVGAFRKPIPQNLFKGFAPISAEKVRDDITRYRVGYFTSYDIANQSKNKVRGLGYKDAFVVALMNGEKIKLSEARNIQSQQIVIDNDPVINDNITILENTEPTNVISDQTELADNQLSNVISDQTELADALEAKDIKGIFYSVQVGAFSKPLSADNTLNVSPLVFSRVNNLYKYSTGKFQNIEQAAKRKADLLENGLEDAFIIAYSDGKVVSLSQATSSNPNRVLEYKNPEIFYLDFGTYKEEVPKEISDVIMNLKALNIRSRPMFDGKQFYSQKYNSLTEAETAINQVKSRGLNEAKIVKSLKDNFDLNYEFKIDLGTYNDGLTDEMSKTFDKLKNLNIQKVNVSNNIKYYTISRNNYEDASTDLNACKSQEINEAKIVVFKGGVETSIDNVLKSFK